jgi:hypothetical protein
VNLLLPPGETATSISIEYTNPVDLDGEYILLPHQGIRPISIADEGKWLFDSDFYSSTDEYPSSFKPHIEAQFYNGSGIALSAFTPLRYIPSAKHVIYYQQVIVTVRTSADPDQSAHQRLFYQSEQKIDNLKRLVQNPGQAESYLSTRDLRTTGYNYLVISQNQFLSGFDTLVHFYKPRGIKAKLTSTETINSTVTGADLQEKIRNYIINEYESFGID